MKGSPRRRGDGKERDQFMWQGKGNVVVTLVYGPFTSRCHHRPALNDRGLSDSANPSTPTATRTLRGLLDGVGLDVVGG
eukprot:1678845-Pyramimonas_sp.AAC.1